MADPKIFGGFTVQGGLEYRAGVPFIFNSGASIGGFATGFASPDTLGVYGSISQNKYDTSDGIKDFGSESSLFYGRSVSLGIRAVESYSFTVGGQGQGVNLSAELSAHFLVAGVKLIIPINQEGWSGFGLGLTFGPGLYIGKNLNITYSRPLLMELEPGAIEVFKQSALAASASWKNTSFGDVGIFAPTNDPVSWVPGVGVGNIADYPSDLYRYSLYTSSPTTFPAIGIGSVDSVIGRPPAAGPLDGGPNLSDVKQVSSRPGSAETFFREQFSPEQIPASALKGVNWSDIGSMAFDNGANPGVGGTAVTPFNPNYYDSNWYGKLGGPVSAAPSVTPAAGYSAPNNPERASQREGARDTQSPGEEYREQQAQQAAADRQNAAMDAAERGYQPTPYVQPAPQTEPTQTEDSGSRDWENGWDDEGPILLDLTGHGINITQLSSSNMFMTGSDDASGLGLRSRTAWAGVGNGVLAITLDGATSAEQLTARDYQFMLWDPSATTDMEALRHVFDTNKDGVLDAQDHDWAAFRLLVTNADGTTTLETLGAANVASINLTEDHTRRQYADGSSIDGITTYTRTDGVVRTVASVSFAAEAGGTIVRTTTSTVADVAAGTTTTTIDNTQYATDGTRLWETRAATVLTTATGNSVRTLSFDDTGDGIRAGGPFPAQAANDNNCYLRRACG